MMKTKQTRAQLSALAAHLGERRETILQNWRKATENAVELTIASSLTRVQFNDHIPGVLDAFALRLRAWPSEESAHAQQKEKDQVTEHGLQRWQQGYQLRELTREWGHLQMAVMEELETYALDHPLLMPEVMPTARRAWAQLCWDGISDSATQYWRLHQAEASGHVRELEQALTTLSDLDRARASAWRDAAHDLKGSMSVVTVASTVLDGREVSEAQRQEFSHLLQRGVSSLHDMLNDLMSLARLDAGLEHRKVAAFDAGVLLTDFCETSLALAEARGLYLKMSGPESLQVHGDRAKVQRILQNLLLNALKYTQSGGVTVIWGAGKSEDMQEWMFCVQDTGPGLDAGPGAPLARQLYEATQTAHAAEDIHAMDSMAGDMPAAPTLPQRSQRLSRPVNCPEKAWAHPRASPLTRS
jgi:signal transduction histidine kinase